MYRVLTSMKIRQFWITITYWSVLDMMSYWSKQMRDHVESFINKGGNVAFFSGNTCWWQVRFEGDNRKMICYKSAIDDPLTGKDDQRVTINWASIPVNRPENSMTGVSYRNGAGWYYPDGDKMWKEAKYRVRAADHWVFEGTGLKDNDLFGEGVLGYEIDGSLFEEIDGSPRVTGKDGTPLNFKILASADLGYYRSHGQGGKATMGMYINRGYSVYRRGS